MVIRAQEAVQHEQLEYNVTEIQHLRAHVQRDQIVPVAVATDQAKMFGKEVFDADTAAAAVLALVLQVVVEMPHGVLQRLVATFRIQCLLDRLRRLHQVLDVNTGPVAEDAPQQTGQVEQEGLYEQHDRDPLVVPDVALEILGLLRARDGGLRQVVCVGDLLIRIA